MKDGAGLLVEFEKSAGNCEENGRMKVTGGLSALQEMGAWWTSGEEDASAEMKTDLSSSYSSSALPFAERGECGWRRGGETVAERARCTPCGWRGDGEGGLSQSHKQIDEIRTIREGEVEEGADQDREEEGVHVERRDIGFWSDCGWFQRGSDADADVAKKMVEDERREERSNTGKRGAAKGGSGGGVGGGCMLVGGGWRPMDGGCW
jgi:hypothetical protein